MSRETFKAARERLFRELAAMGWKVVTYNMGHALKYPYVLAPNGERFTFTAQAVRRGGLDGLSTWDDIRGMSAETFAKNAGRS